MCYVWLYCEYKIVCYVWLYCVQKWKTMKSNPSFFFTFSNPSSHERKTNKQSDLKPAERNMWNEDGKN